MRRLYSTFRPLHDPLARRARRRPLEWLWSTHRDLVGAVAATRVTFFDLERKGATRRLFVLLARHQGWRDTSLIARM